MTRTAIAIAALVAAATLSPGLTRGAHASVIYDFAVTSASGTLYFGGGPFTDPQLELIVPDATYAAGSYSYSASHCIGPLLCSPNGNPNGIDIRAGLDSWSPLFGTVSVNLAFTPTTATGTIDEQGENLDLVMDSSGGSIQSDSLNCDPRTECSFTGSWVSDPVGMPEPGALPIMATGLLGMLLVSARAWAGPLKSWWVRRGLNMRFPPADDGAPARRPAPGAARRDERSSRRAVMSR